MNRQRDLRRICVIFHSTTKVHSALQKNPNILFLQMKTEAMNDSNCLRFLTAEEKGTWY